MNVTSAVHAREWDECDIPCDLSCACEFVVGAQCDLSRAWEFVAGDKCDLSRAYLIEKSLMGF